MTLRVYKKNNLYEFSYCCALNVFICTSMIPLSITDLIKVLLVFVRWLRVHKRW